MTTFDVSGHNGGFDAHQAIAPHFKALKTASKAVAFDGFPFPELAFILRVGGDVNSFGLPGPGNLAFDRKRRWVSVDIVVSAENWRERSLPDVAETISGHLLASVDLLRCRRDKRMFGTDWEAVDAAVRHYITAYRVELQRISATVEI